MRKKILSVVIIAMLVLACAFAVGCGQGKFVQSIEFTPNQTVNIYEDGFLFSKYTITVKYTDGTSRDIPLTEDMISPSEQVKLHKAGEWTVEINYLGLTTTFDITVSKAVIEEFFSISDTVIVYDGFSHIFRVDDDVPAGLTITYPNGYSFVDVGEYDYKVVVKGEGYEPMTKTCKITIVKADYDLENSGRVIESGKTFVYDGSEKTVKVENLPDNLTATYTTYKISDGGEERKVNAAVDAGDYAVYVNYTCSDKRNYNPIDTERITFSITKSQYNLSKLKFVPMTTTYDGSEKSIKLNDESLLPDGVSVEYVSYRIDKAEEQDIPLEKIVNAGKYKVVAKFTVSDTNYQDIKDMEAILTVNKAVIDMSGVEFNELTVDFDYNKGHLIEVSDNLPEFVTVKYYWEIYEGTTTKLEEVKEPKISAGNYTIVAKFSLDTLEHDNNYTLSKESLTSYIIINKINIKIEDIKVSDFVNCLEFDSSRNSVKINNFPQGITVEFKLYVDEGRSVQVKEKDRGDSYEYIGEFFFDDEIKRKTTEEPTEGTYYFTAEFYFDDEIRKNSIDISPVDGEWILD